MAKYILSILYCYFSELTYTYSTGPIYDIIYLRFTVIYQHEIGSTEVWTHIFILLCRYIVPTFTTFVRRQHLQNIESKRLYKIIIVCYIYGIVLY